MMHVQLPQVTFASNDILLEDEVEVRRSTISGLPRLA